MTYDSITQTNLDLIFVQISLFACTYAVGSMTPLGPARINPHTCILSGHCLHTCICKHMCIYLLMASRFVCLRSRPTAIVVGQAGALHGIEPMLLFCMSLHLNINLVFSFAKTSILYVHPIHVHQSCFLI